MVSKVVPQVVDDFAKKYVGESYTHDDLTSFEPADAGHKGPFSKFWKGRDVVFGMKEVFARIGKSPDLWHRCRLKGGKLIVGTVPNQLVHPFSEQEYPGYVRFYTPKELTNKLAKTGWKVVELQGIDYVDGKMITTSSVEKAPYILFAAVPA